MMNESALIKDLLANQRKYFSTGQTKPVHFRERQLLNLKQIIKKRETEIMAALSKDLNKSEHEAFSTEIGILLEEINFTLKHIKKWARPESVKTAITHFGTKGKIVPEPFGTVLIIAPWNYPFQLALSPLVGAIAAGNTAVIKPSEYAPAISALIRELIEEAFPPEYVAVIEGDVKTNQELLKEKFDYIFFTGSVPVGKIVMEAASKHLTPVTLELGGKSPCIVHNDANLRLAARRIAFGKFTNAGQTCIAPDYLLVQKSCKEEFLGLLKEAIRDLFGEHPIQNDNYSRIVTERHFDRLSGFLKEGRMIMGGREEKSVLKMEPTLLEPFDWEQNVMQEEIFGPILPVLEYDDLNEVIEKVNARPKPLALYLFTESQDTEDKIVGNISYGGGCINDTLMHIATPYLPFGGVGESGMGSYHGKYSFQTFSHYKGVLKQTTKFDLSFRYPTSKNGLKIMRKLLK